jgi:hypothetical protein
MSYDWTVLLKEVGTGVMKKERENVRFTDDLQNFVREQWSLTHKKRPDIDGICNLGLRVR